MWLDPNIRWGLRQGSSFRLGPKPFRILPATCLIQKSRTTLEINIEDGKQQKQKQVSMSLGLWNVTQRRAICLSTMSILDFIWWEIHFYYLKPLRFGRLSVTWASIILLNLVQNNTRLYVIKSLMRIWKRPITEKRWDMIFSHFSSVLGLPW